MAISRKSLEKRVEELEAEIQRLKLQPAKQVFEYHYHYHEPRKDYWGQPIWVTPTIFPGYPTFAGSSISGGVTTVSSSTALFNA